MRQRPVLLELAMFSSVLPPETLQLGSGYQGLGLRVSMGYGVVGTGKRERFDFENRNNNWFCREYGGCLKFFQGQFSHSLLNSSIHHVSFRLSVNFLLDLETPHVC